MNSQTADTIQSALDGKQSDWAGLSWKGTEAMEAATALREIADSGSLPPTQVHRARSLADTLQNVSEAAAKGDHSVSVVKTERRSEDGTLRAAKPAEMQAIVKHFDSAAKPKSSGAKSYGREADVVWSQQCEGEAHRTGKTRRRRGQTAKADHLGLCRLNRSRHRKDEAEAEVPRHLLAA